MDKTTSEFSEYLRKLIKDSKMSQSMFYMQLGIKKPYFYDILSGKANPPPPPLQFKAVKILALEEKEKRIFFDLAAKERDELPADIVAYLFKHPNMQKEIRNKIQLSEK